MAAPRFGLANWVTLFRRNLAALMLPAVWRMDPGTLKSWVLFTIAGFALGLASCRLLARPSPAGGEPL